MSINVEYNDRNRLRTVEKFDELSRHGHAVFAIPFEIIDKLVEDIAIETENADTAFTADGEAETYHETEGFDRLLRHMFVITRDPIKWHVTVSFEVEAQSEDDARDLVEGFMPYEANYHIEDVQEAD